MSRLQAAEQLRKVLQIFAATLTDEQAMAVATVYPAWAARTFYAAGDIVSYGVNGVGDPQLYKVAQAHVSRDIYPPGEGTESLYTVFGLDDAGYPIWAQPFGAHDAYSKGDVVNYNGTLYESLIDGNVWSPDVYPTGWKTYGGAPEPEPGTGPETYPEWLQPTGGHDAYSKGDRVTYQGKVYESTIDSNTWSPDTYPQGWKEITE